VSAHDRLDGHAVSVTDAVAANAPACETCIGENPTVLYDEPSQARNGNALNEVRNGIDLPEFETRLATSREEVDKLLIKLNAVSKPAQHIQDEG
jgi:hypothetical protein